MEKYGLAFGAEAANFVARANFVDSLDSAPVGGQRLVFIAELMPQARA